MIPNRIPPEKPPKMMPVDGFAAFVPAIEAGARALRVVAEQHRRAFRPTDMDHAAKDARKLEVLAAHLDVRRPPR